MSVVSTATVVTTPNSAVVPNKLGLAEMDLNGQGTNLRVHTSAAVAEKVQRTLQIEALLRGAGRCC